MWMIPCFITDVKLMSHVWYLISHLWYFQFKMSRYQITENISAKKPRQIRILRAWVSNSIASHDVSWHIVMFFYFCGAVVGMACMCHIQPLGCQFDTPGLQRWVTSLAMIWSNFLWFVQSYPYFLLLCFLMVYGNDLGR